MVRHPRKPGANVAFKLFDLDICGMTEIDLKMLIIKCSCGLIMTKRRYPGHKCITEGDVEEPASKEEEDFCACVIDLTIEEMVVEETTVEGTK